MGKKDEKEKRKNLKKDKKDKKKPSKSDKKGVKKGKTAGKKKPRLSTEERLDMVAMAAYFIAEKHGFDPNRASQDWAEAEQQIEAMLMSSESQQGAEPEE